MSVTPTEPFGPPPPVPPVPSDEQRFSVPVVPPPVIAQPITGWDWDNFAPSDAPPMAGEVLLRDTLPDLPAGLEGPSDSEVSMSLIVDPPRRLRIDLLVALVLAPVVLAGLGLVLAWIFNITLF